MSKKKKRKFYNSQPSARPAGNSGGITDSSGQPAVYNTSPSTYNLQEVANAPASSRSVGVPQAPSISDAHAAEYRVIKHDLIKVAILNAVFLAAVLTLYYTNLNSHYLERWFGQALHF